MSQNGTGTFPDGTVPVDEAHVTNALLQAVLQAAQAGATAQDTREMGEAAKAALAYAQAVVVLDPNLTAAGEPLAHALEMEALKQRTNLALETIRGEVALKAAKERAAAPTPAKRRSVTVQRDTNGRASGYEVNDGG